MLGCVLIAYGMWGLVRPTLPRLNWTPAGYLFGVCAGVLGGACNINGPPVVLYGARSGWEPVSRARPFDSKEPRLAVSIRRFSRIAV